MPLPGFHAYGRCTRARSGLSPVTVSCNRRTGGAWTSRRGVRISTYVNCGIVEPDCKRKLKGRDLSSQEERSGAAFNGALRDKHHHTREDSMDPCLTAQRSILLAGIAGFLVAAPAFAQQPPASPPAATPPAAAPASPPALPPGSPLIGRTEGNANATKLAAIPPPPIPAAADKLPTAKLKLPPGFNIEVYASGIANTRSLRVGDKGTVFVGTRLGNKVTAIVKKDGKTETRTIAEGLYRPNGLAIHKGTLYIAELSQVSKIDNIENVLDKPPKPTVIYTDLPKDEAHGWKFIAIGPDEKLYVPVGQ